jgi:hypothetical protein
MGRDGGQVTSPAVLSVPATFRPLVRGRAPVLKRGADNVVTKLVAVATQDLSRRIRGSNGARRRAAPAPPMHSTLLTVVDDGKVARRSGMTAQRDLLRVS